MLRRWSGESPGPESCTSIRSCPEPSSARTAILPPEPVYLRALLNRLRRTCVILASSILTTAAFDEKRLSTSTETFAWLA